MLRFGRYPGSPCPPGSIVEGSSRSPSYLGPKRRANRRWGLWSVVRLCGHVWGLMVPSRPGSDAKVTNRRFISLFLFIIVCAVFLVSTCRVSVDGIGRWAASMQHDKGELSPLFVRRAMVTRQSATTRLSACIWSQLVHENDMSIFDCTVPIPVR